MARHYFGGSNPLGRHFTFEGQATPLEIVGVVADAKSMASSGGLQPAVSSIPASIPEKSHRAHRTSEDLAR
jgi:hypothetical protein